MEYLIYLIILFTFLSRIFDGIEHGFHWKSKPSRDTGEYYHTADLIQTFSSRAIYAISLYFLFPLNISLGILYVGVLMLDQAIWQIFLNKFAGNGWFSGELDEAEFLWWPTSYKIFANKGRIIQILIGIILILTTLL